MNVHAIDRQRLELRFTPKAGRPDPGCGPTGAFYLYYDGKAAGSVSLVATSPHHGRIGYHVAPEFRGRGLGSAAVSLIAETASGWGMDILAAQCRSDNKASRRILEKTGFTLTSSAPFCPNGRDKALLFMVYQRIAPTAESRPL